MKILKRKTLAALLALSLLASLLPLGAQPALAADGSTVYVGGVALTGSTGNPAYATTDESGNVIKEGASAVNYNIKWDGSTLTLNGAKIKGADSSESLRLTVGIYAFNNSGGVSLNIALEGVNEIVESSHGIWVFSSSTNAGNATLTIMGNGSLTASGSSSGIQVQSNSGDATLTIQNADVTAENSSSSGDGVTVQAGSSSSASLSVDGGSLTATGKNENGAGIRYTFGGGISGSGKPSLTVSGNTIVKANGGIVTNSSTTTTVTPTVGDENGGIVFDKGTGTVYGDVELQKDLEIKSGETLTVGKDASLTVPENKTLTNNGTVTTTDGGSLTNQGTINNSGTLPDSIEGSQPPKITTTSLLPGGTVGTAYSQSLAADNTPTSWSVTEGDLPDGLSLNSDGTITGTPTAAGTSTFTVKAENTAGSDSKELTLTINPAPVLVTSVALNKSELSLYTGQSEILTATVQPEDATNKNVTWSSNNANVATVQNGTVTAVGAGEATITVTTVDGNYTATCTVKVTDPVYDMTTDTTALNFGSAYTGYAQPAAQTVTVKNTGNQQVTVTLPTSTNYIITAGTNFDNGTAILAPNDTATFTVQPKAGLSVGTYSDTITVSDTNNNVTSSITASFTVKSRPSYNPPTVSEETTDAIADAQPGETVTVDLSSGSTKLDKEVFETLAGKDVTLVVDLGDGLSWTVNGSDIPEDATSPTSTSAPASTPTASL